VSTSSNSPATNSAAVARASRRAKQPATARTHDLTAARTHKIIRICERQGVPVLADMAYIGAGEWVTTPKRRPPQGELTPTEQTVNRALSAARVPVERGIARLKSWRIFRRARCSPNRMTSITKAPLPWSGTAENPH
jgi:hypothetical protein